MPVNGLLITLTEDEMLSKEVLLAIAKRDGIELGDRTDRWQPVVVETWDTRDSHEVHEWLEALPGVVSVDVVFSSVSDPQEERMIEGKHQDREDPSGSRNEGLAKG